MDFFDNMLMRMKTWEGTNMGTKFGLLEMQKYLEKGGIVEYDNVLDERAFLKKFFVEEKGFPKIKRKYEENFSNLRIYVAEFEAKGVIYNSMFEFKYIKLVYMVGVSASQELEKEDVRQIKKEEIEEDDFLGVEGESHHMDPEKNYDKYYDSIKKKFSIKERVRIYRTWLRQHLIPSNLKHMKYDNPYEFVDVFERQYGLYYEVIDKLKKKKKDALKVFVPYDGLGAISMICIALGVKYRSSESYPIGKVAVGLEIITTRDVTFGDTRLEDEIAVVCNLDSYLSVDQYRKGDYCIVDENRLTDGVVIHNMKRSTNMRVESNCLDDDFINRGRPISNALPMIERTYNIPLTGKAEAYLIMNSLNVFSDGFVGTRTPAYAIPADGDRNAIRYITTTDSEKICNISEYYLNIVNRNHINGRKGKIGEVKYYKGGQYFFSASQAKCDGKIGFFKLDPIRYDNPYLLEQWERNGIFIVSTDKDAKKKRLIRYNGEEKYIIFLHSYYKPDGGILHFFLEKHDSQIYSRMIDKVIVKKGRR